jgi:hypothetical protein
MDNLDSKKMRALMIIILKMITRYQRIHTGDLDEEIFRLFEKAKTIKFAEKEKDFEDAIAGL